MTGTKQRMPKWASYLLFLSGLVVILLEHRNECIGGQDPPVLGAVAAGFALPFLSVAVR